MVQGLTVTVVGVMASIDSKQANDLVVGVLCRVLGLFSNDQRARLLKFINSDAEVKDHISKLEDLCMGPLKAFTADELKV